MTKIAFFTMDVESYFDTSCVKNTGCESQKEYSCASEIDAFLSLLDDFHAKSTFLVSSTFLPDAREYLLRAKEKGHGIGVHSKEHISPVLQSTAEFEKSLREAKSEIEQSLGVEVLSYRAPCFGLDDERLKIVKNAGFKCDSSSLGFKKAINSGEFSLDGYKKINDTVCVKDGFYEFIISKSRFFGKSIPVSGGAYLRMMPWFLVKYLVKKYTKKADSYVFYVHPFEICTKKLPTPKGLSFFEKVYLKRGRKVYLKRIRKIIKLLKKENYEFKSFEEYLSNIGE